MSKKCLVIYQSTNRKGRKDATGAFIAEAQAFQKIHGVNNQDMIAIPHELERDHKSLIVLQALIDRRGQALDAVVYFGHGTPKGLPSMGIGIRTTQGVADYKKLRLFAKAIAESVNPYGRVVLYACLAGKDIGFADKLDHQLPETVRTIAHLTAGHTSWNPRTEYSGEGPTNSGIAIVKVSSELWARWIDRLKHNQKFRLSFPFMSQLEIENVLLDREDPPGPSEMIPMRP
jgi:hypothetical protein